MVCSPAPTTSHDYSGDPMQAAVLGTRDGNSGVGRRHNGPDEGSRGKRRIREPGL
ncbi:hypothetical protein PISMIDRAFT_689436 [Pisolithus microcarpus 441]|uniref:Unplaced genomic scaffold scaffold_394, whole genome shotgun sequence n=1 Tax=Pisolithus microcarpus 441 TaxID=765257 RepID=A0A0C9YQ65_9AGAM|nr:hypothetical protein PISMIDRAFT_689436 [Pisolithus microcarpus 441]